MRLKEFFERLPRDGWYLNSFGALRRMVGERCQCPVTAACSSSLQTVEYPVAAQRAGLPSKLASRIALAADGRGQPTCFRIRRLLLAHCGLTETARV